MWRSNPDIICFFPWPKSIFKIFKLKKFCSIPVSFEVTAKLCSHINVGHYTFLFNTTVRVFNICVNPTFFFKCNQHSKGQSILHNNFFIIILILFENPFNKTPFFLTLPTTIHCCWQNIQVLVGMCIYFVVVFILHTCILP